MRSPENPTATDILLLLTTLSESISTVRSFHTRWSAAKSTVHRLHSSLSSLNPQNPNPNLTTLLTSLSETLTLTLTLSRHSQSPSPAGKLRTQSDISAAAASLDRIVAGLDLLLAEDEPPSVKTLIPRLQHGSSLSRLAALETLIPILQSDKDSIFAVPAVVRLLDVHETRALATTAVARLSAISTCRDALISEGSVLINHLARVIESDAGTAKETACAVLEALTLGKESAISIGSRGGISSLLEICRFGTPFASASAAGVLKNLAGVKELRAKFIEENAVPVLIRVMSSGTQKAMENSAACLRNLLTEAEGEFVNMTMFKEGILDSVLNYWDKGCDLEPVIGLLRNLASSVYCLHAIQSSELLYRVVSAMDSSSSGTRAEAARAIAEFGGKEMEEAVPKLVRMLEAKGLEEKEAAMKALAMLVTTSSGNRRVFRREEKGVMNVVMLLDPLEGIVDKRYAIAVLLLVLQSRRCRRQMVACGACEFLKRLTGTEVEGAKKLKESLERGKLLGVFPRN